MTYWSPKMKDDADNVPSKKTKRRRIAFFIIGMFAFSALLFWALWAVALRDMLPAIWWLIIFLLFQLFFGIISYVSYKVSLKRWKMEIAKESARIMSLENVGEDEKKILKYLRLAKMFQIICIFILLWFPVILYAYFFRQGLLPVIELGGNNLTYLSVLFTITALFSLWYAYRFPKIIIISYIKSPYKSLYRTWNALLSLQTIRIALSNVVAIWGFILGLFGASWMVTALFFVIWVVSQVLIFPTRKKWLSKAEEIKQALAADK